MRFEAIPAPALGAAKNALADYVAVTLLGRDAPVTRLVASFESVGERGESSVLFSAQRASARSAALINGTAGHAHDYDDVGIAFHPAHPSVAMAPAIFAQAESQGASGREVLTAFVTAYEVWSELASRDAFVLYQTLCAKTGKRQDPCVLDTFMAATDFMRGAAMSRGGKPIIALPSTAA